MVARDIWDVEAAGSNPVTPTTTTSFVRFGKRGFFLYIVVISMKKGYNFFERIISNSI